MLRLNESLYFREGKRHFYALIRDGNVPFIPVGTLVLPSSLNTIGRCQLSMRARYIGRKQLTRSLFLFGAHRMLIIYKYYVTEMRSTDMSKFDGLIHNTQCKFGGLLHDTPKK